MSDLENVPSGVPQGPILGPIFLLHVNDLRLRSICLPIPRCLLQRTNNCEEARQVCNVEDVSLDSRRSRRKVSLFYLHLWNNTYDDNENIDVKKDTGATTFFFIMRANIIVSPYALTRPCP